MFKNLVMMFPSICIASLPAQLYDSFISRLQKLTCAFGQEAALEEEVCIGVCLLGHLFSGMTIKENTSYPHVHTDLELTKKYCLRISWHSMLMKINDLMVHVYVYTKNKKHEMEFPGLNQF